MRGGTINPDAKLPSSEVASPSKFSRFHWHLWLQTLVSYDQLGHLSLEIYYLEIVCIFWYATCETKKGVLSGFPIEFLISGGCLFPGCYSFCSGAHQARIFNADICSFEEAWQQVCALSLAFGLQNISAKVMVNDFAYYVYAWQHYNFCIFSYSLIIAWNPPVLNFPAESRSIPLITMNYLLFIQICSLFYSSRLSGNGE